jgi:hypothetical protein
VFESIEGKIRGDNNAFDATGVQFAKTRHGQANLRRIPNGQGRNHEKHENVFCNISESDAVENFRGNMLPNKKIPSDFNLTWNFRFHRPVVPFNGNARKLLSS